MKALLRHPTAWLPIAMSLAALTFVLIYARVVGVEAHEDEGTAARIFQVIMLVQAGIIVAFATRWLPRAPRPAAAVIALQIVVASIPVVAILMLEA